MHIENFKIFSDLVESQSFSRAAKLNGITQSAVSQQLRAMEKHFDILIVDRSQKQFCLTHEGSRLYDSARELLQQYDKLVSDLLEMKDIVSGTIHLSTIYSVGLHELPPYIKLFMQKFPAVNVRVEYRRSNMVYDDVIHRAVDLGLVAYPTRMRQLETIPFQEDKLIAVCSPKHELAGRNDLKIKELAHYCFVGFDQDIPTRKATDAIFRAEAIEIEPVMEFDNIETVKRAVEINAGIAILPSTTVLREAQQGLLCPIRLQGDNLTRPLAIIHRKGRVLSPAIKQLIKMLTSELPEGGGGG